MFPPSNIYTFPLQEIQPYEPPSLQRGDLDFLYIQSSQFSNAGETPATKSSLPTPYSLPSRQTTPQRPPLTRPPSRRRYSGKPNSTPSSVTRSTPTRPPYTPRTSSQSQSQSQPQQPPPVPPKDTKTSPRSSPRSSPRTTSQRTTKRTNYPPIPPIPQHLLHQHRHRPATLPLAYPKISCHTHAAECSLIDDQLDTIAILQHREQSRPQALDMGRTRGARLTSDLEWELVAQRWQQIRDCQKLVGCGVC